MKRTFNAGNDLGALCRIAFSFSDFGSEPISFIKFKKTCKELHPYLLKCYDVHPISLEAFLGLFSYSFRYWHIGEKTIIPL